MPLEIMDYVARYRTLKEQADDLKSQMDILKEAIAPLVGKQGNWRDDIGYARMVTKGESVSWASGLNALAQTWAESGDAVMKSCGEMILAHRTIRPGSSYLQIK